LLILWTALEVTGATGALSGFTGFVLTILGIILGFRLLRTGIRKSIWRLRNRLIVTYVFIAVVPIMLILILAGLGSYIVAGQVAAYLISSELDRRTGALNGPAQMLIHTPPENRAQVIHQMASFIRDRFPHVQMLVRNRDEFRFPPEANLTPPPAGWGDNSGLVVKDGNYYTWAHVANGPSEVVMLAPLTRDLLAELVPNLAEVDLLDLAGDGAHKSALVVPKNRKNHLPPAYNRFDIEVTWANPIRVASWDTPNRTDNHVLVVSTRPSAVLSTVFGQRLDLAQVTLVAFLIVAALFFVVELISLIVGVSLTRTITGAVHNLYIGTQRVTAGDFTHRIEVHGQDQLATLSQSFNGMTEHLQRLIVVEKEKERLQSELEIAREVQNQLFPKDVPTLRTLELTGLCKPARMVSGDYYDFICLQDRIVALAIGDVAGKGISAALLMASIQSIMRTQLSAGVPTAVAAGGNGHHESFSTSAIVSQLNRQLYANTAPEKYATFFFALYDEAEKLLTYTNAGHLPPILLHDGAPEFLEVTGTVVGAFPMSRYEEKSIAMRSGDLLITYTDGIAEPENEYGEEFGADRIVQVVAKNQHRDAKEIIVRVMEAVEQWTSAPELPDDMTVLLAKRIG
jgi:sigma-B regulation protein RsbU (phosphoserine phosphatase)